MTTFESFELSYAIYMQEQIPALMRQTAAAAVLLLVFAAGICLLAVWLGKRKPLTEYDLETSTAHRFGLAIIMAAFLLLQYLTWSHNGGGSFLSINNVFFMAGILTFLIGAVGLISLRTWGIWASLVFFWIALPLKEIPVLQAILTDVRNIASFNAGGKAGVYAMAHMTCGRILVLEAAAGIFSAYLLYYFTARRLLLRENKPILEIFLSVIEKKKETPTLADKWVESKKDETKDKLKPLLMLGILAFFVVIPQMKGDPLKKMTAGSTQANNAYVAMLQEWDADERVAEDPDWMSRFQEATVTFMNIDTGVFYLNPGLMNFAYLYTYLQYVDASYQQLAVLGGIYDAIGEQDGDTARLYFPYLDETNEAQLQAIASALHIGTIYAGGNALLTWLSSAEHIVVDGFRYWVHWTGLLVPAIVLAGIGILAAVIAILWAIREGTTSALLLEGFQASLPAEVLSVYEGMDVEKKQERIENYQKEVRFARKVTAITVAVLLIALAGESVISLVREGSVAEKTETSLTAGAYLNYAPDLLTWLSDCMTDPEEALAQKESIGQEILQFEDALRNVIEREKEETPAGDATEAEAAGDTAEAETAGTGAAAHAEALLPLLEEVRTGLAADQLPDKELAGTLAKQIEAGMSGLAQMLIGDAVELFN